MENITKLNDRLGYNDMISSKGRKPLRTKIIAGYDAFKDKNGVTRFGETVFETENMIVLGGSQFTLEKLFGVRSSLDINYLEDIYSDAGFVASTIQDSVGYLPNATVCLFGVGVGGADESITSVHDVKYYERDMGALGEWIPIRRTATPLTQDEVNKYHFKRTVDDNGESKTEYYLKSFEESPEIKILWANGEDGEDGTEVDSDVYNTPDSDSTPIETFVEMTLKISKKDVREYFTDNGTIEQARINSIGLFSAVYDSDPSVADYRKVKLFSKLNINNEMLTLSKDLTIVYRIYTS